MGSSTSSTRLQSQLGMPNQSGMPSNLMTPLWNCEPVGGSIGTAPPRRLTEAQDRRRVPATRVPSAVPARSRKPGGRHRAGQRAPGRCPPRPTVPVILEVVLGVLRRAWMTPLGTPNVYRVRALAAIAVALVAPRGTTIIGLCRMLPHEVRRLPIPKEGRRWLKRWFRIREHWLDRVRDEGTPWLALPPMSRGMPRMIGWAMTQTLHRGGAPAWRSRELVRASWAGHVTTMTWSEASRLRGA